MRAFLSTQTRVDGRFLICQAFCRIQLERLHRSLFPCFAFMQLFFCCPRFQQASFWDKLFPMSAYLASSFSRAPSRPEVCGPTQPPARILLSVQPFCVSSRHLTDGHDFLSQGGSFPFGHLPSQSLFTQEAWHALLAIFHTFVFLSAPQFSDPLSLWSVCRALLW